MIWELNFERSFPHKWALHPYLQGSKVANSKMAQTFPPQLSGSCFASPCQTGWKAKLCLLYVRYAKHRHAAMHRAAVFWHALAPCAVSVNRVQVLVKRLDCLVDLPVEMMVELATLAKAFHGVEAPMGLNSRELTSTGRADRAYKWRGPWQGGQSLLLEVDLLLEIEDLPS